MASPIRVEEELRGSSTSLVSDALRIFMALVGVVLIVVALVFVIKALGAISTVLPNPKPLKEVLTQWSDILGFAEGGIVQIDRQPVPVGRVVAALLLGSGTIVFAQIALSFLATGAKMLMQAAEKRR